MAVHAFAKSTGRRNRVPGGVGHHNGWRAIMFLLPSWLLLAVFFFVPILLTFYFAFTNLSLTGTSSLATKFVGFQNFVSMFQDPTFRISVIKTIVFLLFSAVIGQQVLGLLLAVLMNERHRLFRSAIGVLVIAGWVTPEIVVAFIFYAFFSDGGTLDTFLSVFHVQPIAWLYAFPMVSVIIANIWHGTAFSMMVYQAALGDVPKEILESAAIDGAGRFQRFVRVTLPMIKGSIATNMMLITLQTLGVFTLIYSLTGGGPGNRTTTLPIYMYQQAFSDYQLGYGTAISLILLMIGIVASFVYLRMLKVKL
ncbi:amino acid ABC transporter permease [Alicyclobacillus hesperidum]|uniref:Amino acid ABC transporter permease n=2 Tax=Alicyclobacillus hesperidum TaxID=89784 RepID=A0A1H2W1P0_9BACL|nr:amino acid ABC transporter permease [Alicyclobacillus hesperidum]SDW74528.1 carbohydrate ABC transporter membrane protein 1, CUT1 family [Alicyclobacillus hesperidum]